MTPDQYCRDKAAPRGSTLHYSLLTTAPSARAAITALYAFRRETHELRDTNEPGVARAKIDWWRSELDRLYKGNPQHPVTRALLTAMQTWSLPVEYFHEVLDGMEQDLEQATYATFKELVLYCQRTAGTIGILSSEILGYEDHHTPRYAQMLGIASQLTEMIRNIRTDAARGRCYIPAEELESHRITVSDLSHAQTPERARDLFRFQVERANEHFEKARAQLAERDRYRQRSGLIAARIYETLLDEIEFDGFRLLEHRIELTPIRKLWLAYTTLWRENRRHKRSLAQTQ